MPTFAFFSWIFLVWSCGWLFFPLARRLFPLFPDGGLAIGRLLFLAFWGVSAFWLGILGIAPRISAFLIFAAIPLGLWFWKRDLKTLKSEVRARKRAILSVEAIFLAVFLTFFALRGFWSDTDGTNGEKSMDSALIGSLVRAQKLPPDNPYAAGVKLQSYYYLGHLETALLTRATFSSVRWSYNWMCATLPALCFAALFSLGAALTGRLKGGAFVAGAVLGLGTLQPLIQWFVSPDPYNEGRLFRLDPFAISRVIPFSINEFPFFTFNQADLHAHYFDFQWEIALMALAWAIFGAVGRRKWALAGVAAVVAGAQIVTNTWDFPAFMLLIGLAIFWSAPRALKTPILSGKKRAQEKLKAEFAKKSESLARWPFTGKIGSRVGLALGVALVALVLAAPFLLHVQSAAQRPALLSQPASPLREWMLLWGPIFVAWSCFWAIQMRDSSNRKSKDFLLVAGAIFFNFLALAFWRAPWKEPSPLTWPFIAWGFATAFAGALWFRGAARFACLLAICGLVALGWSETTWAGFLGDANNAGFDDHKRQDTVFKFGLQCWLLWGTAAASGAFLTRKSWPNWFRAAWIPVVLIMLAGNLAFVSFRTRGFQNPQFWDGWGHLEQPEKDAANWLLNNISQGNILEAEQKEGGDYSPYTRYTHATGIPTVIGPQSHSFQWGPVDDATLAEELRAIPDEVRADNSQPTPAQKLGGVFWKAVWERKERARRAFETPDAAEKREILKEFDVRAVVWGELERAQYNSQGEAWLRAAFGEPMTFGEIGDPRRVSIFRVR